VYRDALVCSRETGEETSLISVELGIARLRDLPDVIPRSRPRSSGANDLRGDLTVVEFRSALDADLGEPVVPIVSIDEQNGTARSLTVLPK